MGAAHESYRDCLHRPKTALGPAPHRRFPPAAKGKFQLFYRTRDRRAPARHDCARATRKLQPMPHGRRRLPSWSSAVPGLPRTNPMVRTGSMPVPSDRSVPPRIIAFRPAPKPNSIWLFEPGTAELQLGMIARLRRVISSQCRTGVADCRAGARRSRVCHERPPKFLTEFIQAYAACGAANTTLEWRAGRTRFI
jgi:hypothetical protein